MRRCGCPLRRASRATSPAAQGRNLRTASIRHALDVEDFFELRAHRQIEQFAGRQLCAKPFVVKLHDLAALREPWVLPHDEVDWPEVKRE